MAGLRHRYLIFVLLTAFLTGFIFPSIMSLERSPITGEFHEDTGYELQENDSLPDQPPQMVEGVENSFRHGLKPNFSTNFSGYRFKMPTTQIRINRDGYRGELYSREKPHNTTRIVALGDSVTFGWGMNHSDIWTEVLERRLNENSERNFQVINLGVFGYNTTMEIGRLKEKGLKYDPDAVILQYHRNDARNQSRKSELETKHRKKLKEKYPDFNMSKKKYRVMLKTRVGRELQKEREAMPVEEDMALIGPELSRLEQIGDRNGFDTYVMGWQTYPRQSDHLNLLTERNNLNYIDMREELELYDLEKKEDNVYRLPDGHPNKKGHKLIAEGVLDSRNFPYIN